jgi:hypothetical protein
MERNKRFLEDARREQTQTGVQEQFDVHLQAQRVQVILILRLVKVNMRREIITGYQCCTSTCRIEMGSEDLDRGVRS